MQKNSFYYLSKDQTTQIHAIEWLPEGEPRAILQICHGMVEYIDRYSDFAEFLAGKGYYVVGNDHLGHGESVRSDAYLGYFHEKDGNECVIADIHQLRLNTAEKYPDIPYFMLGHSMGSFLLRQYLCLYAEGLKGAIIMGTGSQPSMVLTAAKAIDRCLTLFKGEMHRSKLIDSLAFGSYNKAFMPARTSHDWLSRNTENVDKYLKDPWCTYMFTLNAYYHMFRGISYLQKPANIAKIPKDLPLFFVSGDEDPVGEMGKGVQKAFDSYQKAGMKHLNMKLYEKDRHEILNEPDRAQVYQDLYCWLESLQNA